MHIYNLKYHSTDIMTFCSSTNFVADEPQSVQFFFVRTPHTINTILNNAHHHTFL